MATWYDIQKKRRREQAEDFALYTPQFPDLQELAQLVPQGLEALPGIEAFAGGITEAQQAQQLAQMERAAPGVQGLFGQAFDVTGEMLSGIVPTDVQQQIQADTAAAALGAGVSGAPFMGSQYARNLGLTSLDLINRGMTNLLQLTPATQAAFTAEPFEIAAELPGLEALYSREVSQEQAKAATAQARAGLAAARAGYGTGAGGVATGGRTGGGGGGYFETAPRGTGAYRPGGYGF